MPPVADNDVPLTAASALDCPSGLVNSANFENAKRFDSVEAMVDRFWANAPPREDLNRQEMRAELVTPEAIVLYNAEDEGKASIAIQELADREWIIGEWLWCSPVGT